MTRRGRPPNPVPACEWSIMIPIDLALKVELRLSDPVTCVAQYGSRSKLIQALLFDWIQRQQSGLDTQKKNG